MDDDYEEIDSTPHEPTQEEIRDYAKWLGADLNKDQDLFYIAREALLAKIPPGWKLYQKKDGSGDPFYFNVKTGESSWDHPLDQHYKDLFAAEKRKKSRGLTTKAQTATVSNRSNLGDLKPLGSLNSNTNNYPQSLLPNNNRSSNISTSNNITSFGSLQQVNNLKSQIEDELEVIRRKGENDKADFQRKCENEIEEMRSNHRKKMESLRQQNDLESADLQKLTTQKKKQKDQLEDEIREMKRQYDKTREETEDQQRKELRKLKNDHETEIDNENKRFNKELSELKKSHQDTINSEKSKISPSTLQADHDSEIEKLKAKFRDEINKLNQEHEEEVESLKKRHQSEIDDINDDHKKAIRQLKEKNKDEENQIKLSKVSSNSNELSDLQADLESKKKAAIKKFEEEMEQLRSEQERKRKDISLSKSNKKDSDTFALQQKIDDLEANKQHLEEQISKLKKTSSSSNVFDQQQINDLKEEKMQLESSIAQLRQKKNTLSTSISTSQQQLDDLKDEKQQLEIEIDSIKRKKNSLLKESDSISKGSLQPTSTALLEDEKQKLKERIEVLTSKFEAEKKRLQPNSREMLELQSQRDNYETEKAELESLREAVRQQRTKLQQRLSAKESAQLKSMQSDFDREKEEIEEGIEELRNNLKREKLKNNTEMQKLKRNLDIEKERCQNELDTMKMNYRSQLEIAKSSYEREMANYQNKKSEIEADTAQLKDYYNEQKRRFNVSNLKQIELNYQQERDLIKRQHQEEIDKMNRKFKKEVDRTQQQNQFDANDDDDNDQAFSSRSKNHHKSKKSRDHHKLPVWLSYASFMQASIPPTSPSLATPKRKKVKNVRSRLEINMPLSFTTPESNRYYLSLTSSFIANFAPINENNNNFNTTFYNGMLSRAIPSQSVIFDDKIMQNLRKQKTKIERVQGQFDTNYSSLSETIQISVGEVMNLCQGYKDLIAEQNRAINSLALDFQQQTAIMARNFRDKIYEMQNSHKIDMIQQQNKQAQQAYSMIAPQINHPNNYLPIQSGNDTDPRRRKKTYDDFESSNDLERSVRMWKRK